MNTEEMRKIIESAKVGDTILVRPARGRKATYTVRKVSGSKARRLSLDGSRGAMRVLFDDGNQLWIREASSSDVTATRVSSVSSGGPKRSGAEILRDMAIREAGLPPHYGIDLHPRGFQAHVAFVPIGDVQASAYVAVCKCWEHHADQAHLVAEAAAQHVARLPFGYQVMPLGSESGLAPRFVAVLDEDRQPVVSPCTRMHAVEAVVDAWTHAQGKLLGDLGRHRTAAIDRDVARGDASRCRRALQQIREIATGSEPSGKELASGQLPEQVVAEVGHALRVESKGRDDGRKSASRRLLEQPVLSD